MLCNTAMGQARRPTIGGHRHSVLVADDCPAVRQSLSMALSFYGDCDVATATSGEDALELLRAGLSPCVVFLDLMMLRGRAREFRAAQRAEPRLADIPVVVLTCADEGPGIRERLGARAWVVKPPELDELLGLIAHLCGNDAATASRSDNPPARPQPPGRESRTPSIPHA
jgi:two-component system, chemotaxis family, chemotaxis protein CheY